MRDRTTNDRRDAATAETKRGSDAEKTLTILDPSDSRSSKGAEAANKKEEKKNKKGRECGTWLARPRFVLEMKRAKRWE